MNTQGFPFQSCPSLPARPPSPLPSLPQIQKTKLRLSFLGTLVVATRNVSDEKFSNVAFGTEFSFSEEGDSFNLYVAK